MTGRSFGYDVGRSKFLDAQNVRPPFQRLWKYDGGELIEFPPIVVDDRLYFIDNDGLYVALDAETGKIIWKKRISRLNASSPAYDDGVLYSVSLEPGQAIAVRAKDGKVLWRKELGSRAESSPMVVRGRMYFGDEGGQFYALDVKDGSTIWQTSLGGSVKAAPALHDGTLFVGDYGGNMNAVRASDGELLWQTPDLGTGVGSGRIYSTAAVAFGRVYAGDVDNRVYSYEEETGEIAWTFSAGDYVYSGIAAADTGSTRPAVYFGSHDRNIYALDAKNGEPIWSESAGGQISGPATVVGDVVYVSTFSGNSTLGFDLSSGRRVFSFDDGEYGPVVSDGEKLYLTGGTTVIAFQPFDAGEYKYETKEGQRGVISPPSSAARRSPSCASRARAARPAASRPVAKGEAAAPAATEASRGGSSSRAGATASRTPAVKQRRRAAAEAGRRLAGGDRELPTGLGAGREAVSRDAAIAVGAAVSRPRGARRPFGALANAE